MSSSRHTKQTSVSDLYVRDFKNTNNHLLISVNQQVAVKIEPEYTLGMPDGELTEIASNFRIPNLGANKKRIELGSPKKSQRFQLTVFGARNCRF